MSKQTSDARKAPYRNQHKRVEYQHIQTHMVKQKLAFHYWKCQELALTKASKQQGKKYLL